MYVYVCVCTYVCICVCTALYVCMDLCKYACMSVRTYTSTEAEIEKSTNRTNKMNTQTEKRRPRGLQIPKLPLLAIDVQFKRAARTRSASFECFCA